MEENRQFSLLSLLLALIGKLVFLREEFPLGAHSALVPLREDTQPASAELRSFLSLGSWFYWVESCKPTGMTVPESSATRWLTFPAPPHAAGLLGILPGQSS